MTSTATDPAAALAAMLGASVDTADFGACQQLLGHARRVRGWVDAFETTVGSRVDVLHAATGSAPADDVHARCGGVSSREGKRKGRRSKTIDKAPGFGDALAAGEIGAEHVDALANGTDKLDDTVKASLFDLADELLNDAKGQSPEVFARSVRDMARLLEHEAGIDRDRQQRRDSYLKLKADQATGMYRINGELHPELGHLVQRTLERHVAAMVKAGIARGDRDYLARNIDRGRLTAEALGELLSGGHQATRPAEAEIIALVDWETLLNGGFHPGTVCETGDGAPVPPVVAQRWMCNATIIPIIVDSNGNPFNMGRTIRTANRTQRRALRAIYRTCAADNCDVPFDRCEIHHVNPWEPDGLTDLDNMIPLCSRHHHVFHADGWTLHLAPDRTITITQPDGTLYANLRPRHPTPTTGQIGRSTRPAKNRCVEHAARARQDPHPIGLPRTAMCARIDAMEVTEQVLALLDAAAVEELGGGHQSHTFRVVRGDGAVAAAKVSDAALVDRRQLEARVAATRCPERR